MLQDLLEGPAPSKVASRSVFAFVVRGILAMISAEKICAISRMQCQSDELGREMRQHVPIISLSVSFMFLVA